MHVYAITIFLGAFLLFQIQPVIAKYLLPWFGGVPAVWTTCMLCFQTLLLVGYGYAHVLVTRTKPRSQGCIHMGALCLSIALLAVLAFAWPAPVLPGPGWKPADSAFPVGRILLILVVGIGLPYLLLSTTGPLLQAWFSRSFPGRSPYPLYTLSNAGSLLALLTYPILFEPFLDLKSQALIWTAAYALYAMGAALCASRIAQAPEPAPGPADGAADAAARPDPPALVLWAALPCASCILLLATTNLICQEVAVIPFLWIVPLSLYLISFVVCFAGEKWYPRVSCSNGLILAMLLACVLLEKHLELPVRLYVLAASAVLFVCCMVCHGELYRLRPPPSGLTAFYGMIALGGAAGGALVTLLAPRLFKGLWEYHIGLFLCLALFVWSLKRDRSSWLHRSRFYHWMLVINLYALAIFLAHNIRDSQKSVLYSDRSFYGILRVREKNASEPRRHVYKLFNGGTVHGVQFATPDRSLDPLSYYNVRSAVGLVFSNLPPGMRDRPIEVGVIGLGAGTLAAYGRPGDVFRFYEINPDVVALARSALFFSYVKDSRAQIETVPGDARLSLEREAKLGAAAPLDLLFVDAFSGDSIPVHLLTKEAWTIYLQRLRPDGILAVHISNRYLDLWPVTARLARTLDLDCALVRSGSDAEKEYDAAVWVLATRNREFLRQPAVAAATTTNRPPRQVRLWTDQYSNLLQVLR